MEPASLKDRIRKDRISFSTSSPESFNDAVDKMIAALGGPPDLLGLGEALHGGEDILIVRNMLFKHLVENHGYTAIAIESSFPRGRVVDGYVNGRGPGSYGGISDTGFSHGFGRLDANRELVEWMQSYNASPLHDMKLRFYGFDSPTEMTGTDSPRQVLTFVLDFLDSVDDEGGDQGRRSRIESLIGSDSAWESMDALMDPEKSRGASLESKELRAETEDLIAELERRQPELIKKSDVGQYSEALQYARVARQLLAYHAEMARDSKNRVANLLGIRDAMMADNLLYMLSRERARGKVFSFAHNRHLQRGKIEWELGPHTNRWWPAGAHLTEVLGPRYKVIGSGVGTSQENGIAPPEQGTLEAMMTAGRDRGEWDGVFIPTKRRNGISEQEMSEIPTRSGSTKNSTYFPLDKKSFKDFDYLMILESTGYSRGGPQLQDPNI